MNLSGTAYHPELGELVQYEAFPLSQNPDTQVAQTVDKMGQNVREDTGSDPIQRDAAALSSADPLSEAFWMAKRKVGFRRDEQLSAPIRGSLDGDVIEVLIRPRDLSQMRTPLEDCDGFASLTAARLRAVGVPCNFVTVAADRRDPSRFSHVYLACYPDGPGGVRVPLDVSHGPYPGWECTEAGAVWRMKEWPIDGPNWGELLLIGAVLFLAARVWGLL